MKTQLKHSVYLLLAFFSIISCGQNKKEEPSAAASNEVRMEEPSSMAMSKDDLDNEVQSKAIEKIDEASKNIIDEAVAAIDHTYEAIKAINDEDKDKALDALERATGKLEILLAREPNTALLPIEVTTETRDLITSLEVIERQKKTAQKALKDGYLQVARRALADMESEVEISTVSLPLATYPEAMKIAAVLVDENKMDEAKIAIYSALNTLVVEKEIIPLPILRAEVMIAAAQTEDAKDENKKKEVLNLLENAEYQLILAEELGYGKKDKEYKELNEAINTIKESVKAEKDSQGLFNKLKTKLKNFKKRTSTKTSSQN